LKEKDGKNSRKERYRPNRLEELWDWKKKPFGEKKKEIIPEKKKKKKKIIHIGERLKGGVFCLGEPKLPLVAIGEVFLNGGSRPINLLTKRCSFTPIRHSRVREGKGKMSGTGGGKRNWTDKQGIQRTQKGANR